MHSIKFITGIVPSFAMKVIHAYFLLTWATTVILMIILQINFFQMNSYNRRSPKSSNHDTAEPLHMGQSSNTDSARKKSDSNIGNKRIELQACSKKRKNVLLGKINITETVTADEVRNDDVLSRVTAGGLYQPTDCQGGEGTAIIIPYRDRPEQLKTLVYHLHTILQRQRLRYGIFVTEMAMPVQFNRGMLANAGFLTAYSFEKYACFIFHDVDLLLVNDHNIYTCDKAPRHLVVNSTKYPDLPYQNYIGGVLAIKGKQFAAINGFSNMFFGWGGEDDDLFLRIKHSNMTLVRPDTEVGTYIALHHTKDASNPPNPHRKILLHMWKYRHRNDGLNSMKYQRLALEFRPYYTWLLIQCVESSFFENFSYIQADEGLMFNGEHGKKKKKIRKNANVKVIKNKVRK